jgi:hypothetical protein
MFRKLCGAVLVLVFCVGLSLADEIRAVITKVEKDKITFHELKGKGKDVEKGDAQTLPYDAEKVKVVKTKFNKETMKAEPGDPVEDGIKNKMFTDIGEKGVPATIVTENKKITEIRVRGGKGGGK